MIPRISSSEALLLDMGRVGQCEPKGTLDVVAGHSLHLQASRSLLRRLYSAELSRAVKCEFQPYLRGLPSGCLADSGRQNLLFDGKCPGLRSVSDQSLGL